RHPQPGQARPRRRRAMKTAANLAFELGGFLPPAEYDVAENRVVLRPATAERLGAAMKWSRESLRKQPSLRVEHDLSAFDAVGAPDLSSCIVRAETAAPIARVE